MVFWYFITFPVSALAFLRSVTNIKPKKGQNVPQIKLSVYANYTDLIPLELQTEVKKKRLKSVIYLQAAADSTKSDHSEAPTP